MCIIGCSGIEDQLNWHGKPLGDKSATVIAEIEKRMKNNGANLLKPIPPINDAPQANIDNLALSEPPNYKLGQQASGFTLVSSR